MRPATSRTSSLTITGELTHIRSQPEKNKYIERSEQSIIYLDSDGRFWRVKWGCFKYLPSATKLKGNVFTPVCHSVHGGGGCLPRQTPEGVSAWGLSASVHAGIHPMGRDHPGRHPPGSHCHGRYASYWNAFLFPEIFQESIQFWLWLCFEETLGPLIRWYRW